MKTQELRIGNLVNYEQTTHVISAISNTEDEYAESKWIDGDGVEYYYHTLDLLKPIELTEDWLTRLGFNSKYKSVHIHWNIEEFGLDEKSNEDDEDNIIEQEEIFYYNHSLEVKYVHQLQNLYYALTGKELNIKK